MRLPGDTYIQARLRDERPDEEKATDICKWIDTHVMLADCLTKGMKEDYLIEVMCRNYWNFKQPDFAKQAKADKQEKRRETLSANKT